MRNIKRVKIANVKVKCEPKVTDELEIFKELDLRMNRLRYVDEYMHENFGTSSFYASYDDRHKILGKNNMGRGVVLEILANACFVEEALQDCRDIFMPKELHRKP